MTAGPRLPTPGILHSIEGRAAKIPDAVKKLRFLRASLATVRPKPAPWRRLVPMAGAFVISVLLLVALMHKRSIANVMPSKPRTARTAIAQLTGPPDVWLVERRGQTEVYSNGLRIENQFAVSTKPRQSLVFSRDSLEVVQRDSDPAGIVFHTTESQMAPFEAHHNDALRRNGLGVLGYVREHQLYHFVIDRFGRVHRVVAETDFANHAGKSVWADDRHLYLNLNQSFLGISFEAQTESNQNSYIATSSQVFAARVLTEMLRNRYRIPEPNCVTHAQVSLNPGTMRIGYHTDWAGNFPFRDLGLRNGYEAPLAGITEFGFSYDEMFLKAIGVPAWKGITTSEEQLVRDAVSKGLAPATYRKILQQRYRLAAAALRKLAPSEGDGL